MRKPRTQPATPVTSRQIAQRLGVSQSTVSRVLSGAAGYTYSDETRSRILAEAERLNYRPNAVGRSLRERRTRVVGFCSRHGNLDAHNMFLAEIIGDLQRACAAKGQFLLLLNFDPRLPVPTVHAELMSGRIDGLVLHADDRDPLVGLLAGSTLPVVAVADRIRSMPSALCDDQDGMAQAVAHLVERGHRRIAFLNPPDGLASVRDRAAAYESEMKRRGLQPICVPVAYEDAEPALDVMLSRADPVTAVCCWNDVTALVLLGACRRAGIRVPDDLAIVGFDGLIDDRIASQRLTTVVAHWPEVTAAALAALGALLAGKEVPAETVVPVTLRTGETT